MRPERRSITGLLLAAGLVPLLAGVFACLPVAVGDPEESWIDADLTGMWVDADNPEDFLLLEPWDPRTWLLTGVSLEWEDSCGEESVPDTYAGVVDLLRSDAGCLVVGSIGLFKAWQADLAGHRFLTWEPKGAPNTSGDATGPFDPEVWFVFRVDGIEEGELTLRMIDPDFEGFDELPESRRDYEAVIARHADDEDLYVEPVEWRQVPGEHVELFAAVLGTVVDSGS